MVKLKPGSISPRDCGYLPNRDHALFTEKCREVGAMLGSIIKDPSSFIQKS